MKAELCVLGSDLLDRIVEDASSRGFHCVARVDAEGENPPEDVLAANLTFPNATPSVVSADRGVVPYMLFNFRVTLATDEKVESVRSILLNAETLQEHTAADVFLEESLTLPEDLLVAGTDLTAAYQAACLALERSIRPDVEAVRGKAGALLQGETSRIDEFYDTSIKELYESRMQDPLETERVFRGERDRRIEEAKRKYSLAAQSRLVNVRTILIPTTTVRARLANKRAVKDFGIEYDAVNLETNLPACESCGASTATVILCSRGHLACDACDRGCAFCDEVACGRCADEVLSECATCVRLACADHSFLDEIGRKTYCGDHIHACAICGRMVGPSYVKACRSCGQSYCAVCVEDGGRCTTCRTLKEVPTANPDVARATAMKGEPRTLTTWLRGENGKFVILIGKGAVFQYLYVLDKEGRVVRRQKGMGLAG